MELADRGGCMIRLEAAADSAAGSMKRYLRKTHCRHRDTVTCRFLVLWAETKGIHSSKNNSIFSDPFSLLFSADIRIVRSYFYSLAAIKQLSRE